MLKVKEICLSRFKEIMIIYLFLHLILINFIKMDVNPLNLVGSVEINIMHIDNFTVAALIQQIILVLIVYYSINGKKLAIDFFSVYTIMNIIGSLMVIETSNFSFYNIILIIEILFSVLIMYCIYNYSHK